MSEALANFQFYRETNFKKVELNGRKIKIPEEWEVVKLGEVVKFQRGYSYRSADISETKTRIRFITINDIEKEGGLKRNAERIYLKESMQIRDQHILFPGDVLIANTDMTKGFIIGAPLLITPELLMEDGILVYSMDLTKLIFDKKTLDSYFLFYLLSWPKIRTIMKTFSQGVNVQHLNHNLAKTLNFPLPPLEEQKKIAEVLRSIDDAVQAVEESIEKLERIKKGAMEQLLTKGIGHARFKEVELNGRKVKIPEEWKVVKLGEVAEIRRGASPRPKGDPRYFGGDIPWIKISDVSKYKRGLYLLNTDDTVTEEGKNKSVYCPDGTLIVSNSGTIGEPAIIQTGKGGCIHDGFVSVNPIKDIDKIFLYYFFEAKKAEFHLKAQRGTQGNMNTKLWKETKLPLPPLEEQKKIAEILRTIDDAIEIKRQKKEKLERMKKVVMEKLLTGEVRVK